MNCGDDCPTCGNSIIWMTEISSACPWGTGYEILRCESADCSNDTVYAKRWVGH